MTIYNHVNFFSKIVNNKIICLDLGNKNIGVAISDQGLKFANPLKVIKRKNFRTTVEKLTSILELENIAHYPTRYRLRDNEGNIWTLPTHSVEKIQE